MYIDKFMESYKALNDALKVDVKIDSEEVMKIVVRDLISKRNAHSCKIQESFDNVLLSYYLTPEEFDRFVIYLEPIN